jgi:hypothetical protein
MNLAVSYAFCLLYEVTGDERYLRVGNPYDGRAVETCCVIG